MATTAVDPKEGALPNSSWPRLPASSSLFPPFALLSAFPSSFAVNLALSAQSNSELDIQQR